MTTAAIHVDHIARIEGHGNIHVGIEDGVVTDVRAEIVEPARLFESMVRGRNFADAPYIASRICGICSASHAITDILAIEGVFGVEATPRTHALRELLVYGSYLQNHATHLFVFAAPDFLGEESMLPLAKTHPVLFEKALELKRLGNELCTAVGGRSVHPITAVVGGFTHEIDAASYLEFAQRMEDMVPFAQELADTFHGFTVPKLATQGELLCMTAPGAYPVCDSNTFTLVRSGITGTAAQATEVLEEYQVNHSGAFFARVRDTKQPYFTGALARINAGWGSLSKTAKVCAAKVGLRPPEYNTFMNNVAQAVEIVDALVRCAALCRQLAADEVEGTSTPVPFEVKAGRACGFTEAPRGMLFHDLTLDDAGRVTKATIMTPTAQNLANMEADMRLLAESLASSGASEAEIKLAVEMLVRAYDPCLSCSVH